MNKSAEEAGILVTLIYYNNIMCMDNLQMYHIQAVELDHLI